jgi:peptidoglycan/LPS O-acetylase OafA/YrhL
MQYLKKLDGLRFIAISLVLLEHFARPIGQPISAGFYGVDLFFCISGFLITTILIKPNKNSFKHNYRNFIGRRIIRIFPIYYLSIVLLWILQPQIVQGYLPYLLTYTFNYAIITHGIPSFAIWHLWSLSVEEQFYLIWPLIALTVKNKPVVLITIVVLIIAVSYSQLCFKMIPSISAYNYYSLLTRMGSLGLGALGAVAYSKRLLPQKLFRSTIFEYFMLLFLCVTLISSFNLKMFFLGICSIYFILKAAYFNFSINSINRFLTNRFIVYIGTISYGIYIYHLPIDYFFSRYLLDPFWKSIPFTFLGLFGKIQWNIWIIKLPLCTAISVLVASCSFRYIEKPILGLKEKYFKN